VIDLGGEAGYVIREATMKELYADFNDFAEDGTLPLICAGSIESIGKLKEPLMDGEQVILTDGDLKVMARVFRQKDGSWEGRSDWAFFSSAGENPEDR
jgi:hypothetical protein